ncbi:hypothetical protein [Paenibacillus sp. sptzw28]|uniref:hypothetical protein n=1 Tax=Paenibacillus sp. sptzw28 TaxID=715179 RepID=UPI0021614DEB|nr:hypothetical protein [Paenibacillus sp. sptzw28]
MPRGLVPGIRPFRCFQAVFRCAETACRERSFDRLAPPDAAACPPDLPPASRGGGDFLLVWRTAAARLPPENAALAKPREAPRPANRFDAALMKAVGKGLEAASDEGISLLFPDNFALPLLLRPITTPAREVEVRYEAVRLKPKGYLNIFTLSSNTDHYGKPQSRQSFYNLLYGHVSA